MISVYDLGLEYGKRMFYKHSKSGLLTFRLPTFFCDADYQGGGHMTPPLQLPATIFFIAHMHITGSPHLAHHTETSFQIIYANFIRQHIMI